VLESLPKPISQIRPPPVEQSLLPLDDAAAFSLWYAATNQGKANKGREQKDDKP
jgi:hypothetical protein